MLQQSNSVRGATNLAHLIPLTELYVRAFYTAPVYSSLKFLRRCVFGSTFKSWLQKPSNKLLPFALCYFFWLTTNPVDQAKGHPGFTLQTVTSLHRPGLPATLGKLKKGADAIRCLPFLFFL